MGRGCEVRLQRESTRGHNLMLEFCWNWHRGAISPVLLLFADPRHSTGTSESDGSKL